MNTPSCPQSPIHPRKPALLVIDVQNDYFPDGLYPLWNTAEVLERVKECVASFQAAELPVILIQHIADPQLGLAPFFNSESSGAQLHDDLQAAATCAPVVVKHYADSFHQTDLAKYLEQYEVTDLYLCGMMTQNCVTHTALSTCSTSYAVHVVSDACTTVDEMLHQIALHALSTRVNLVTSDALGL